MSVEVETSTGRICAVYFRLRKGKSARMQEFDRGNVFVDYNRQGELLGIEMLAPSRISVLDKITMSDPESRRFVQRSVPREMAPA